MLSHFIGIRDTLILEREFFFTEIADGNPFMLQMLIRVTSMVTPQVAQGRIPVASWQIPATYLTLRMKPLRMDASEKSNPLTWPSSPKPT